MNFLNLLQAGGVMMIPLSALGIIALAIGFDKFFTYRKNLILPKNFTALIISDKFDQKKFDEIALNLAPNNFYAPFLEIFSSKNRQPLWQMEVKAQEAAKNIEEKLNSNLWVLETIITSAPLLGLLGTIFGMMNSFKIIGQGGVVNPTGVSSGVAESLIATGFGIIVALIALVLFNFYEKNQNLRLDQLEMVATRMMEYRKNFQFLSDKVFDDKECKNMNLQIVDEN